MSGPANGVYRVACSAAVLRQLREWGEAMPTAEARAAYVSALRTINRHLMTDPTTWGDPWFRLGHLV